MKRKKERKRKGREPSNSRDFSPLLPSLSRLLERNLITEDWETILIILPPSPVTGILCIPLVNSSTFLFIPFY